MPDLADDFCRGYDQLDETVLVNQSPTWRLDPTFLAQVRLARDAAIDGAPLRWPRKTDTEDGQRSLFAVLKGLDWAFKRINPRWMGRHVPASLVEARSRLRQEGRLNTNAVAGSLVPKLSSPTAADNRHPQTSDLAFDYLQRATAEQSRNLIHIITRSSQQLTSRERQDGLTIGCIAFIDSEDELDVQVVSRAGSDRYRIRLRDDEAWASSRVAELIQTLDASGVQLAVLPEMALTGDLLAVWRRELQSRKTPADSELRWIMAGTGNVADDDPPFNTAVVLDATTGELIAEQSKQFRFDLDVQQQTGAYSFKGFPSSPAAAMLEDIQIKRSTTIIELGSMRMAILICEDAARLSQRLPTLHRNGVSHLIVPVLAKPTRPWFWEQQAADAYVRAQGMVVIVVNSLVLGRMANQRTPIPSSLVHSPWGSVLQQVDGPCDGMRTLVRDNEPPQALDHEA